MTDLVHWQKCSLPGCVDLVGEYACLEPFVLEQHEEGLLKAVGGSDNADLWEYLPIGPFETKEILAHALEQAIAASGWKPMVIIDKATNEILGLTSYMRIRAEHGSAEIGCVVFGRKLKRSRIATEAIYLLIKHLFEDLKYRRCEWNCNGANEASTRAALRFGFTYEGTFRNDMVIKGKNRDTAWYSMIDADWPLVSATFSAWLAPENFNQNGQQKRKLDGFRKAG